jgi:hypothetical protein
MMTFVGFGTYVFYSLESAKRFANELKAWGIWSTLGVSCGGARGFSVRIV